jgi:hypothetical protein
LVATFSGGGRRRQRNGIKVIFLWIFKGLNGKLIIQNEVVKLLLMPLTADTLCCHTFIALI